MLTVSRKLAATISVGFALMLCVSGWMLRWRGGIQVGMQADRPLTGRPHSGAPTGLPRQYFVHVKRVTKNMDKSSNDFTRISCTSDV